MINSNQPIPVHVNSTDYADIDFFNTRFNFFHCYPTPAKDVFTPLEIAVATYTLAENIEFSQTSHFIKSQTPQPSYPNTKMQELGHNENFFNENGIYIKDYLISLEQYLNSQNNTNKNIFIIFFSMASLTLFKNLFSFFHLRLPVNFRLIVLNKLMKDVFAFHQVDTSTLTIQNIANKSNIPHFNDCSNHKIGPNEFCPLQTIRRLVYTCHAVLQQHKFSVQGDYITCIYKKNVHKKKRPNDIKKTHLSTNQQLPQQIQHTLQPLSQNFLTDIRSQQDVPKLQQIHSQDLRLQQDVRSLDVPKRQQDKRLQQYERLQQDVPKRQQTQQLPQNVKNFSYRSYKEVPAYKPKSSPNTSSLNEFSKTVSMQPIQNRQTQLKPLAKTNSVSRPNKIHKANELTEKTKNVFLRTFPNIYVHFIDFKCAYKKHNVFVPNEVGITSYHLLENNEIVWYQEFINPGEYKYRMENSIKKYGIDPRNPNIKFLEEHVVSNKIKLYFNQFTDTKFICVRDYTFERNYCCLKQLFNTIPSDFCIITHTQLFKMICDYYQVPPPKEFSVKLESTYNQLVTRRRCEFHRTTDNHIHCALGDSRSTAEMIVIELKKNSIPINDQDSLPKVESAPIPLKINTNNFLFIGTCKYDVGGVSEILMSKVTFKNYQIQTSNTSDFQYLLPESYTQDPQQNIVRKFFMENKLTSNELIYRQLQNVIDSGDNNQVIVFLNKINQRIDFPQIKFSKYLCVTKTDFLNQYLKEINCNVEGSNVLKDVSKITKLPHTNHCSLLHHENSKECCLWKFDNFKASLRYLFENRDTLLNKYGMHPQDQQKKPVVPIRKKDYPNQLTNIRTFVSV